MPSTPASPVSPKVVASAVSGSFVAVILFLTSQVGHVDVPESVVAAVVAAVAAVSGWLKVDPLRRSA